MNVQFDWWLLLVGLVIGAGLTWLVLAEVRRRDDDLSRDERAAESDWIVANLATRGMDADTDAVQEVLRLHRTYLANVPSSVSIWDAGDPSWPTPEDLDAAERDAPTDGVPTADGVVAAAATADPLAVPWTVDAPTDPPSSRPD